MRVKGILKESLSNPMGFLMRNPMEFLKDSLRIPYRFLKDSFYPHIKYILKFREERKPFPIGSELAPNSPRYVPNTPC